MICSQMAMLPIQLGGACDSPLQIVTIVWHTFFKIWTSWVGCDSPLLKKIAVWRISNLKKWGHTAITIFRVLSYPIRSLSRIVCRGQERPKASKGMFRPDFQANIRPTIFFKMPMSPQDTRRQLS
jgi:hypothetical protein